MPRDESPVSGVSSDATARERGGGGGGGRGGMLCEDPPLGIHHTQPSLGSRVDLINKST